MEYRSFALGSCLNLRPLVVLAAGLAVSLPALADDVLAAKRTRADTLEREAKVLRGDAARVFKDEEMDCRQRLLVNDCIKAAKERRLEKIEAARKKETEQAAVEREIRHAEHLARREARLRRRIEEGPPPAVVIQADRPAVEATPLK